MPTFNDSENIVFKPVPPGDYVFTVVKFEQGISTSSGKTKGSAMFDLTLELMQPGVDINGKCFETLYDHETTAWKIDCFLKAAGVVLKKGDQFEFDARDAAKSGAVHVNPYGLRGWCNIGEEDYIKDGKPTGKKRNRVNTFYTNKPKVERDTTIGPPTQAAPASTTAKIDPEDVPFD